MLVFRKITFVVVGAIVALGGLYATLWVGAFTGPSGSGGVGAGAVASDAANNVAIGTSTVSSTVRLMVLGSTTDSSYFSFDALSRTAGPLLLVRNDGKVSIATSSFSATSTLRVAGYIEAATGGFVFPDGSVQTVAGGGGGGTSTPAANVTAGSFGSAGVGGNYAFPAKLSVGTSTAGTGDLYVVGNVGIGATAPGEKLEILDSSAIVTYPLSLINNYGAISDLDGVGIKFGRNDTQSWGSIIGIQTTPSDFNGGKLLFQTETSDALGLETKMVIDKSGNVGIGTSAPPAKLDVRGEFRTFLNSQSIPASGVGGGLSILWNKSGGSAEVNFYNLYNNAGVSFEFLQKTGETTANSLMTISSGTVTIGGGTGKINVGTVDPIYTILGKRYATYMAAMVGVKEETTGVALLHKSQVSNQKSQYEYFIDFGNAPEGSDLWLFSKVTQLKDNFDNLTVLLTPGFDGNVWYKKDAARQTLAIFGSAAGEVSYRLTAPRFDAAEWPNRSDSTTPGFILNE